MPAKKKARSSIRPKSMGEIFEEVFMKPKWWFLLALMFLVVIFTIQNYAVVRLKLLFWVVSTSQAILVFASLFIGVIIGALLSKKD